MSWITKTSFVFPQRGKQQMDFLVQSIDFTMGKKKTPVVFPPHWWLAKWEAFMPSVSLLPGWMSLH